MSVIQVLDIHQWLGEHNHSIKGAESLLDCTNVINSLDKWLRNSKNAQSYIPLIIIIFVNFASTIHHLLQPSITKVSKFSNPFDKGWTQMLKTWLLWQYVWIAWQTVHVSYHFIIPQSLHLGCCTFLGCKWK